MTRLVQVKKLTTAESFREHLASIDAALPFDDEIDPDGPLAQPLTITDASVGEVTIGNRFAVLPMEGWDGTTGGEPTDLVHRRWQRFGDSGCGLVWGEATAVRPDGRANPNQLVLTEATADEIGQLPRLLDPQQIVGIQLTHSGRWSRPLGAPAPRTAYAHPLLDERVGCDETAVFSDDELDELAEQYIETAVLAQQIGFDFVDVKHCHGYLLHELLSAVDRPGRYGGSFENRTRFLRTVVEGVREHAPRLFVAMRLSIFDFMPFVPGPDGVGVPATDGPYRYAFGGDGTGLGIDLAETHELLFLAESLGIGLVSTTAGSPYYNPHIQRPAYFPPSDGYKPPEDPLVGVARQLDATAELAQFHSSIAFVGSGYSYIQDWLPNVGQAVVRAGDADLVGLGRMILSYPELAHDVLAGKELERRLICRTFSDCTTAPRNGLVSGCYPLDDFYKTHPDRAKLVQVKKAQKS